MTEPSQDPESQAADFAERDRSAVRLAALITLTCAISGAIAIPVVGQMQLARLSIFYGQFARIEPPALVLVAITAIAAFVLVNRSQASGTPELPTDTLIGGSSAPLWPRAVWIALAVLAVTVIGTNLIFHRFIFADDEYSAYFQALIFARGKWSAAIPADWCRWAPNITPTTIGRPQPCTWHLGYLPIHSMVRALFLVVHADWLSGPVSAAITVLFVGATARRLWPGKPHRMWIAMAVLATSTQLLVMSMTMYAMPTHLLFASVWIWLYVVDRPWSIVALPIVGVLAMGVHSPIPHGLLIPIFWLRYVRQRRYGTALYVAVIYAAGIVFWYTQLAGLSSTAATVGKDAVATATQTVSIFHLPSLLDLYTNGMNVALIATWNTPIAIVLVFAAGVAWHRLDTFERDATLTLLFIVLARAFSNSLQGEGWGYRFIYASLGVFALLAASGADVVAHVLGARTTRALLVTSLALSVMVELPMRGVQVESIIRPYYRAYDLISHQTAKIVVFPSADFMWGRQLLRNDPFFERGPVVMAMHLPHDQAMPTVCEQSAATPLTVAAGQAIELQKICAKVRNRIDAQERPYAELMQSYPGQVRVVTRAELVALGLPRFVVTSIHVALDDSTAAQPPR